MWKSDSRLKAVTSQTLSDSSSAIPAHGAGARVRALWTVAGVSTLLAIAVLGVSSRALAFSDPSDYGKFPKDGNLLLLGFGSGRYYTGSPADGYSCENCHSAEPPLVPYSFPLVQTGLPLDGYVPGQKYNIEISSPVANAQLAAAIKAGNEAASTLTAEFVAEDGSAAGTVQFASESDVSATKFPGQWCNSFTAPESGADFNQYGMNIYAVDTNSTSLEITLNKYLTQGGDYGPCTVAHGKTAEGVEYERRCVIATKPCGVQTARFTWIAPPEWSGTIWFSVGFVATYKRTAQPNDADYVTTMNIPINPAYAGPTHETKLDSGCSVVAGPHASAGGYAGSGMMAVVLGLFSSLLLRSRGRRRTLPLSAAALVALAGFGGAGCGDGSGLIANPPKPVGAYESIGCQGDCQLPVTCRKVAWPDAGTSDSFLDAQKAFKKMKAMMMKPSSTTVDTTMGAAGTLDPFGGGAAGSDASGKPPVKTLGTVAVSFTTTQPADVVTIYQQMCKTPCTPNYVTVWIEDANGKYVRSLVTQIGNYPYALDFNNLGSDCEWPQETVHVITSATIPDHKAQMTMWDGMYGNGKLAAPAGLYHLRVEIQIDEKHHQPPSDYPFMFGDPAPTTMSFPPEYLHTGVTLTYTPNP